MNIEEVRDYALSMNEQVTELLFADRWLSWRICGKWFLLTELDTPEPWVAVKLRPGVGERLREQYEGVRPAYHMNRDKWITILLDGSADEADIKALLAMSYSVTASGTRRKSNK